MPLETETNRRAARVKYGLVIGVLFAIECAFFIWLTAAPRIPRGSDGFQYFALQYYFLNNAVTAGEIPLWVPFLTHGNFASVLYLDSSGIVQQIALVLGPLLRAVPFLAVHYAGFLADEILLFAGTWLLARRFFRSPLTLLFVCASLLGSCAWSDSPWFNFHLFYGLPLILHWLHRFFETGRWRYYLAAGCFFAHQCLGNLPYYPPLLSLVVFLYFLFYFFQHRAEIPASLLTPRGGLRFIICSLVIVGALAGVSSFILAEAGWTVRYNPGRNPDASVSLTQFLTYGANLSPWKWLELFTGWSPHIEFTLYAGLVAPILALWGLISNPRRDGRHFLLMIPVFFFFSLGGKAASFFYTVWPFMFLYRHVGLAAVLAKPFLCLAAGMGLEALSQDIAANRQEKIRSFIALIALLILGTCLLWLSSHSDLFFAWYKERFPATVSWIPEAIRSEFLGARLLKSGAVVLLAGLWLGAISFARGRAKAFFLTMLILTGLADSFSYKFAEASLRTLRLNPGQERVLAYQPAPFSARRDPDFWKDNPRARVLFPESFRIVYQTAGSERLPVREYFLRSDRIVANPIPKFYLRDYPWYRLWARPLTGYGADLWLIIPFFFKDPLGSPFRVDSWPAPFDRLIKAFWGVRPGEWNETIPLLERLSGGLILTRNPAFLKIAGASEDKIQFFSRAFQTSGEEESASLLTDPSYAGDQLFLLPPEKPFNGSAAVPAWSDQQSLAENKRLRLPYKVKRYDANHLVIGADAGNNSSLWIYYSDIWHPGWKATVNGRPAPVWRANLAYKAVRLDPGANEIHFYFSSPGIALAQKICALLALFWLIFILASLRRSLAP